MTLDAATERQNQAADPRRSTWLAANAGSGKTRVLTDRVARLLLDGVQPQNILCLTYTKAAASEMQNRLFRRLGSWSMKPDRDLEAELRGLGVAVGGKADLARARRLFARAIETPGGLRIQTIHSFCASLLRRFPLEAGVSPAFVELDDRSAVLLQQDVVERLAEGDAQATVDGIAAHFTGDGLDRLTGAIARHRKSFTTALSDRDYLKLFGADPDLCEDAILKSLDFDGLDGLLDRLRTVLETGSTTDLRAAERLRAVRTGPFGFDDLRVLFGVFLTGAGAKEPFAAKVGKFPTKASREVLGPICHDLDALMLRVEAAREAATCLAAARKSAALSSFAAAFLHAYDRQKQLHGWLDFDDLIQKTLALLSDPAVAGWVLYRLDGGLDHILVDEAQDTSPDQWQVIERLAQEFTAGLGARDGVSRTIFVVGDKKQSIYSFQGADAREFDRMRMHFGGRLHDIGVPLQSLELEYSFRSSDAILRFVEAALPEFSETRHRAFRDRLPGRVDLWPAVEAAEQPEKRNWYDPVDIKTEEHHDVVLARRISEEIERLIADETIPAGDGTRRRITAGDFLILVRRRSGLFEEIIRACKARGLAIAGADRLKLGAELAVKDLAAILAFLATPEDDLSLAAALRSPLFGWSEAELYRLGAGRSAPYLWTELRDRSAEFPETLSMLKDLRNSADYLRPYDLIERILTKHDGRRRLLARLGPEAEDGIDTLLSQALAYERIDVPSLTGFLTWLDTGEIEVKRQMDAASDRIRVMTVHGAKGLEAPIVILPDTARRVQSLRDEIIVTEDGTPVWRTSKDQQPKGLVSAIEAIRTAQGEEANRLFYVAVTRAETWLIFAGSGNVGKAGESWHQIARRGLEELGAATIDTPTGTGLRYTHRNWDLGDVAETPGDVTAAKIEVPDWMERRAPAPARAPKPLAPSDLGGAKVLFGDGGEADEDSGKAHGRLVHSFLEHLQHLAPSQWPAVAVALAGTETDDSDRQRALDEASRVLLDPEFGFLFDDATLSEVDLSAALSNLGGRRINGTIDKLVVEPRRVLAVDFKTNAVVPGDAGGTPEGILRQMGAYLAALETIYPGKRADVAILWTAEPRLMPLPNDIVRQALRNAATS
ncbi:MAG: double-strand break repair helicase AddA [Rhodobacter sp.]|nr:double-strand break repair helicase AddA [Rhodobacter sp.]